ncbi:MAG: TraR/DksA C4-type zinc finger protein [Planctomycetes bacterium]|nr:TraR/DksA C4-type zinc finger protein [Planctomycetota bacterium]
MNKKHSRPAKTKHKTVKAKPVLSALPKPKKIRTSLSKSKLASFKTILIGLKSRLTGNLSQMENESLSQSRREASGDLSDLPLHMADAGTDTFEQDFTLGLMENEGEEIHEIDAALDRIEEQTFGVCERCSKPISEKRLKAIPFSRLCIDCKEKEEVNE